VVAAATTSFRVVGNPATVSAGSNVNFTVTAQDTFGNATPTYSGTVHFTSSDPLAAPPGNTTLTNGTGTFQVALKTAGSQTLTAADSGNSLTGTSNAISVNPAAAFSFTLSGTPTTITAGSNVNFTLTVKDTFNNVATNYAGTVHFSSTDSQAFTPADTTLTNGVKVFALALKTKGVQTVTAADSVNGSLNATSNAVTVNTGALAKFNVVAPLSATGNAFNFTVTATDSFNNTVINYAGTVHFSSTDAQATLPLDSQLTSGTGVFSATFKTSALQTLTATDTVASSVTGSAVVNVGITSVHHYVLTAPANSAAGSSFVVTVVAEDINNGITTGYTGTVHFTSSDGQAVLPANATLVGGMGTFNVTLKTSGAQTITASDTAIAGVTGSATVNVSALAATHYALTAPQATAPGHAFAVTVTAQDTFNNTATTYAGTIHFSSSDTAGGVVLPSDSTLTNGKGVFSATLVTLTTQSLTATDTLTSSITATANIYVSPPLGIPTNLTGARGGIVSVPIIAGSLVDTVNGTSGLSAGNFVVLYDPAIFTISSSDVQIGALPSASTGWTVATNMPSPGTIIIGLQSDGVHLITSTDGGSLVTINFHVNNSVPLAPNHIDLAADLSGGPPTTGLVDQNFLGYTLSPAPQDNAVFNPGFSYSGFDAADGILTVTGINQPPVAANDAYSTTARALPADPGFNVPAPGVLANDTDPQSFPLTAALQNGPSHGSVTLNADGSFTYSPTPGYVGSDSFTYKANDGFNNSAPATVSLTVTSRLSIPTNLTGSANRTVVVPVNVDNPNPPGSGGITAAVLAIDYDPNVFTVSNADVGLGTVTTGWTIVPNVNPTTGQIGIFLGNNVPVTNTIGGSLVLITFHINAAAPLGPSAINLAATNTPGATTVTTSLDALNGTLPLRPTVSNNSNDPNVDGVVNVIVPPTLVVNTFTPTPTGFVAVFDKPLNPSQLNLYDAVFGGNGAADMTLTGSNGVPVHGSLVVDPSATTITFVKSGTGTAGLLAADTYTATFRSASNAFKDSGGNLLDGNGDGVAGDDFVTTFTTAAPVGPVLSIPDFARGPDSTTNVLIPAKNGTGIPITLTNASGVTDVTFNLNYNPALLNITGTLNGPAGTLSVVTGGGVASFTFHSGSALSGNLTLGQIVATVPDSAAGTYKAKEVLHLSNIAVNAGSIPSVGNDAIHVVAYLGDTSGDGQLSGLDASQISRVSILLDTGFAAYPLLDPLIVGDVGGNNLVDGSDVTLVNRRLAGYITPQIPDIPSTLTITPAGPDPALSVPTALEANAGSTVVVPVNIDTARPDGSSGAVQAILALRYDPRVFDVTTADIQLGSLTADGWQMTTMINAQTGEIGIDLFSSSPIQTTQGGSLVNIAMHVRDNAPSGPTALTVVNQVNPTGQRVFQTSVADALGAFILHSTQTAAGEEPGAPGLVLVTATSPAPAIGPVAQEYSAPAAVMAPMAADHSDAAPLTTLAPMPAAEVLEQVFGDVEPIVARDSTFAQPGVNLGGELGDESAVSSGDKALQLSGAVQRDWVPAELLEQLDRSSHGGVLDAADDLAGLEAFFAREGSERSL
jgi:hypothetical protein